MQQAASHNQPEYSVSEISGAIKRNIENAFGYVRVRGEISQPKLYSSGHLYLTLKDEGANLSAVCWKGNVSRLKIKPEEGVEVIATGKMTTFQGQSKYQLVIESMEVAGVGALMALLEKRKKELETKGLFAAERKKKIPFMPTRIGVVTSPTGAVIKDILHRISERFPCHVMVWPVRVQGQCAEDEVAAAINGFNNLSGDMRPDVIIVARGGGSIEDLWCFNEEKVIYAVADSRIPIISAVGHETDTTLIDYVSDMRAPTPTAAAEFATPVLSEWKYTIAEYKNRLLQGASRLITERTNHLRGLLRGLPRLSDVLANYVQRLDVWSERLHNSLPNVVTKYEKRLARLNLRPQLLVSEIKREGDKLNIWNERLAKAFANKTERLEHKYEALTKLFDSYNYKNVLKRGFALVKSSDGKLIKSASEAAGRMNIEFADGEKTVKAES